MTENEIAREVVDVAYKMHKRLGLGLFESVYRVVMVHELRNRNLLVTEEIVVPI